MLTQKALSQAMVSIQPMGCGGLMANEVKITSGYRRG